MNDADPRKSTEEAAAEALGSDEELVASTAGRSDLPPLRAFNAFAFFENDEAARRAIVALDRAGIDGGVISALAFTRQDAPDDPDLVRTETEQEDVALVKELAVDGGKGGALGAVLGALGGAVAMVAIPGLGIAIGAGVLGAAAGGAIAGAGLGSFANVVAHTPSSRSWQRALVEIGDGELVVGVHVEDQKTFDEAIHVFEKNTPRPIRKVGLDGEPLT